MPFRVVDIRSDAGKLRPELLADLLTHAAALAEIERALGKLPRADLTAHWVVQRLRAQRRDNCENRQPLKEATP